MHESRSFSLENIIVNLLRTFQGNISKPRKERDEVYSDCVKFTIWYTGRHFPTYT